MFSNDLEQLSDETFRRPVGHANASAFAHHARDFTGGLGLVGREHDTEG